MIQTSPLFAGLLVAAASMAQNAPATTAPSGSTGLCRDGSYWTGASKKGACRGHKGVKDWYAASTAAAAAAAPAAPAAATVATQGTAAHTRPPVASAAAPGGGPGQVWANKNSKVYHCSSDRYYGKTKDGVYLSEADAKAQGFRPDHGKACQ